MKNEHHSETYLQNYAVRLLAGTGLAEERSTGSGLEHLTNALTRHGRALQVVLRTNLLRNRHSLRKLLWCRVKSRK